MGSHAGLFLDEGSNTVEVMEVNPFAAADVHNRTPPDLFLVAASRGSVIPNAQYKGLGIVVTVFILHGDLASRLIFFMLARQSL
jgi:hypothetical protein